MSNRTEQDEQYIEWFKEGIKPNCVELASQWRKLKEEDVNTSGWYGRKFIFSYDLSSIKQDKVELDLSEEVS